MYKSIKTRLQQELKEIHSSGRYKSEEIILSPQDSKVRVTGNKDLLNLCANNYLGLANHPKLLHAAQKKISSHGLGMASVRFICGTQDIHKILEEKIASFLGLRMLFYTLPPLMLMAGCSSRFLVQMMPSSAMNLIMPQSLMEFAYVKQKDLGIVTMTWRI